MSEASNGVSRSPLPTLSCGLWLLGLRCGSHPWPSTSYPPQGSRSPQDQRDMLLTASSTPGMILLAASLLATSCGHPWPQNSLSKGPQTTSRAHVGLCSSPSTSREQMCNSEFTPGLTGVSGWTELGHVSWVSSLWQHQCRVGRQWAIFCLYSCFGSCNVSGRPAQAVIFGKQDVYLALGKQPCQSFDFPRPFSSFWCKLDTKPTWFSEAFLFLL